MKKVLLATGIAALAFVSVAAAQGYVFNGNLTVGSTGPDVVQLQTVLMNAGINIPAIASGAAAKGYFGSQTKAAVMQYQAARGIPNTGFVGPLTRAALNGGVAATNPGTTVVVCPVGYVCTPQAGTQTPGTVVTPGVISTPGVEGTLSATQSNTGVVSTAYEAQSMIGVLGVKLEAKTSDIAVQRVKLDLGTDTKIYNKIYSKLYVTDGSNVLASSDLNSSTVVKDGTRYYLTIAGFNLVIPKNSSKTIIIKADVRPTIDSSDIDTETYTIRFDTDGIRGVDGAGIDQYAADTSITKTITVASDLSESATLKVSLNGASPKKTDVVAAAGSNENELDRLTLLAFDVKAEKDAVTITDINIAIAKTGTGAAVASSTVYIYEGSTEIDSVSISGDTAVFSSFDQTIAKDQTKTYTVKADIRSANGTVANFTASASSTGITSENSRGDSVTESGTATGYRIGVRNVGPEITLVSKSITTSGAPQTSGSSNISTSTLTANFVFRVKAVGGDLTLGQTQSTTSPFFSSTTPSVGVAGFRIYRNGSVDATVSSAATSTSFTIPADCTVIASTNSCTLSEGTEVLVPATVALQGRSNTGPLTSGLYSIGIQGLNWSGNSSNFMDGELEWITPEVSFP